MIPIVLASASAARAAMLKGAGVPFSVMIPEVDEDVHKGLLRDRFTPESRVAQSLADLKAVEVSKRTGGLVIGADQTLVMEDGQPCDKTRTPAQTRARLQTLRGQRHTLHSAATLARHGEIIWRGREAASLRMRTFSDAFLEAYLSRHGHALAASLGAYHYEGDGAQLFESVEGDYHTILGLPLIPLLEGLRQAGGLPC